ncbi:MAG: ABC transporter substrate-binding protein [Acidobacteria bacterium]|nr:MAG: ABC transporter substrate-binding protein [Acidobacteriota bacterium]
MRLFARFRCGAEALALLIVGAGLLNAPAAAQTPSVVTVSVFPGGFNWPSFVAQEKGLFDHNGIQVILQATPNSVAQMTGLAEGKFDLAITAVDNIVAYVEGQGQAPIGPQPDFFAFMGSDSGFLSLVAAPEIKSVGDLKGKTLSVDARSTGYAFVLFEMLARNGLATQDYRIEEVGGMVQRWNALLQRKESATLLSAPFNIFAKEQNFNELAHATQVIGPYQGNVGATRRSWARENRRKVIAFIRGYAGAIDWLYDRTNREEAIRILMKNLPEMSPELARQSYDELLDPHDGFLRHGRMNLAGLRTVLALRSRYAEATKKLADPTRYYDSRYYSAAMRPRYSNR